MVNPETAIASDRFLVDFGGKEVKQFKKVSLPSKNIPVVEHNTGSSRKRYPTKHAEQTDHGGTFTAVIYARGEKNSVDTWMANLMDWNKDVEQQAISVTAKTANDEPAWRWEFTRAQLTKYEYQGQLDNGEALEYQITISYEEMERKQA